MIWLVWEQRKKTHYSTSENLIKLWMLSPLFYQEMLTRCTLNMSPCHCLCAGQRAVCHRQAMQREKLGFGIRRQVHQEAAEHGELPRRAAGGDRAGGGHPAADAARQHRHAARRLREPHRRGAHPGAVSKSHVNCVKTKAGRNKSSLA